MVESGSYTGSPLTPPRGPPSSLFHNEALTLACASCGPTLSGVNPGLSPPHPPKTHWHAFPAFFLPSSQLSRPLLTLSPLLQGPAFAQAPSRSSTRAACGLGAHAMGPYSLQLSEGNVRRGRLCLRQQEQEWMLRAGGSGLRGGPFWEAELAGAWPALSLNVCPPVLWVFCPWTASSRVREIICFSDSQEGNSYRGVGGESASSAVLRVLLWGYLSTF